MLSLWSENLFKISNHDRTCDWERDIMKSNPGPTQVHPKNVWSRSAIHAWKPSLVSLFLCHCPLNIHMFLITLISVIK